MKVFHVTPAEIEALRTRLQLEKFRLYDAATTQDERFRISELHRKFNYELESWVGEITK